MENEKQNLHKQYWSFVYQSFKDFILRHKKSLFWIGFALVLILLTYFGYLKYSPEFSLPIGTFKTGELIQGVTNEGVNNDGNIVPKSNILDRSIFNLSKEVSTRDMTSKERVTFIAEISGLKTKEETGTIEDIGTDGLTLLIHGNSEDGQFGLIQCNFSSSWKQRIALLKKGSEIKFFGTIAEYNLPRGWIVINDCQLGG